MQTIVKTRFISNERFHKLCEEHGVKDHLAIGKAWDAMWTDQVNYQRRPNDDPSKACIGVNFDCPQVGVLKDKKVVTDDVTASDLVTFINALVADGYTTAEIASMLNNGLSLGVRGSESDKLVLPAGYQDKAGTKANALREQIAAKERDVAIVDAYGMRLAQSGDTQALMSFMAMPFPQKLALATSK